MANKHSNLASLFSDIAAAIRGKTGNVAGIRADDFPDAIAAISGGSGGGIWVESGSVPSESSNQMLLARIALSNPDRITSLLGCSVFFTDEAGNLSDATCVIFPPRPGGQLGTPADYSATEGTVEVLSDIGEIHWTSSEFNRTQSSEVAHYIAYGIDW